ncbi:hypothetical protein F4824DRAFT_483259 [Ustulina deusta]|nr:hypothetical protein F4824DRAFT_483259 [Ustulina deusta]
MSRPNSNILRYQDKCAFSLLGYKKGDTFLHQGVSMVTHIVAYEFNPPSTYMISLDTAIMAPSSKNIKQTSTETGAKSAQAIAVDRSREDDASTLRNDEQETSLKTPTVDNKPLCWKDFQVDSCDTATVFEGWEIISVRPTIELTALKRIVGVNILSTYRVLKDGYTGVRAIPSYSQVELAHAVATAQREWTSRKFGLMGLIKQDTYGQNLARRIFELPACLPSKLGALLDCRFVATNKNPHIRREWKIVLLKPIVEVMADEEQQPHNLARWNRGSRRQNDPVQKWLVILRGQDTKVSERGFRTFNTMSNPWLKVDERPQDSGGNTSGQRGPGDRQ